MYINGAAHPLVNLDYFDTVDYGDAWEGRHYSLHWPASRDYING